MENREKVEVDIPKQERFSSERDYVREALRLFPEVQYRNEVQSRRWSG